MFIPLSGGEAAVERDDQNGRGKEERGERATVEERHGNESQGGGGQRRRQGRRTRVIHDLAIPTMLGAGQHECNPGDVEGGETSSAEEGGRP